jgi:hypothetical protein
VGCNSYKSVLSQIFKTKHCISKASLRKTTHLKKERVEHTCVNVAYISDTKYKIITTVTKMFQKHSVSVVYTHTHTHTYIYIYIIYIFIYSLYLYILTVHLVTIKFFCFLILLFTN